MSTETVHHEQSEGASPSAEQRLVSPQLILNSHMLRSWYAPADPDAVAALVPPRFRPLDTRQVFLNQYLVERDEDTSGFGAFELTYVGPNLAGHDVGGFPAHWCSQYLNSNAPMGAYALERGFPVTEGRTTLERNGDLTTAVTEDAGVPIIRTTARVGDGLAVVRGQIGYMTAIEGEMVLGRYPFVAELADPFEMLSIEFLEPDHPVYALRPKQPLEIALGFYSRRVSFCYPGGEERV